MYQHRSLQAVLIAYLALSIVACHHYHCWGSGTPLMVLIGGM